MNPVRPYVKSFRVFILCSVGVLLLLFWNSLDPRIVMFANDGPLGAQNQRAIALPQAFQGVWYDLNYTGMNGGSFSPTITSTLLWLLGPLYFAKFYVPLVCLFLGLCAWLFFRQLGLHPLACILGALAAMLNSNFLSTAAWGVGPQVLCFGLNFLALTAAISRSPRWRWTRFVLAGFAVGMGLMEGADIGALFSLLVAAFLVFQAVVVEEAPLSKKIARGIMQVSLVAVCAAFIATHALTTLIGIEIKGVVGTAQDTRTRLEHWDWATQWSLPKREALGLIIPGLFGNRMDTPKDMGMFQDHFVGGNYWGAMGRDPAWDRYFKSDKQGPPPDPNVHFMRFTGGGDYAGVLVVLVALWAACQSFRKDSAFTTTQRKPLWFWAGVVGVALLLAFGRYAPFYRILYALPYFSTIRNPAKFLHILSFAIVILFAYGIHGFSRRYLESAPAKATGPGSRSNTWWARAGAFERRWVIGCGVAIAVILVGWWIYAASRHSLEEYLQTVGFDDTLARKIAGFSIHQVGWFVLVLAASVSLVTMILSGLLAGRRAKWAAILLGLVLVADLGRADLPWIVYWNYKEKYASNPVVDFLRKKPFENRVAILPFQAPPELSLLDSIYRIEWTQHLFLYYNIQSLDIIQMPRVPQDVAAFESALQFRGTPESLHLLTRRWALTNTRYLLGPTGYLDPLNEQIDPALHRFRIVTTFDIVPKPGAPNPPTRLEELTASTSAGGAYALFEFTGALPRAKLFSNWQTPADDPNALRTLNKTSLSSNNLALLNQVGTNDFLTLEELAAPAFDPAQRVLLASPVPSPTKHPASDGNAGTVEFSSYAPKDIKLHAVANAPSILMLADKYDPNWQVWVDGRRAELLRCDFIMRGVYLQPGTHNVEFLFKPDTAPMYVSLAAIVIGLLLLGFVIFSREQAAPAPVQPGTPAGHKAPAKPARTASR
jgi:hypothetical protein